MYVEINISMIFCVLLVDNNIAASIFSLIQGYEADHLMPSPARGCHGNDPASRSGSS